MHAVGGFEVGGFETGVVDGEVPVVEAAVKEIVPVELTVAAAASP